MLGAQRLRSFELYKNFTRALHSWSRIIFQKYIKHENIADSSKLVLKICLFKLDFTV